MKKQIIVLLLLISVFGCNNSKKTTALPAVTDTGVSKLNGTWVLNYITGPRIAFDGLYPQKKPTLIFNLPTQEASGNTSCNSFTCKISIEGNKINFGDALSTMMACEGNGEQVFLKTLKQVNHYSIGGDTTLTMTMGDIAMMRFVRK